MVIKASIGQVKRDISELVNRVAYGGERVVLTSRGRPKAALVSIGDYDLLQKLGAQNSTHWDVWLSGADRIAEEILERRDGIEIDVETLLKAGREDRETRDERITGSN
ncbi:MAG: type II toxin-antitoxin system Phd/YefM family antitoxin [Chloroflexota bacterium]|nr:type II toxin-antitoxin system Phd/YefM family antitoxin [Chloroflexota bacterium]